MAREPIRLDGGDGRGHVENLGRLGQRGHVVLERLTVDRLDPERHLGLLIDEDQLAVLRRQDIEVMRHASCSLVIGKPRSWARCWTAVRRPGTV
jgi:hypothetical protein